jgi:hypothetical protein
VMSDWERPSREANSTISFVRDKNVYSGDGLHGRRWRITRAVVGWRLEFQDPGDETFTFAGIHATLALARREAEWVVPVRRRKPGEASSRSTPEARVTFATIPDKDPPPR